MHPLKQTPLVERHLSLGASMVDFGGWNMPVQYAAGIVHEHLQTRRAAGIFDVSHMGRFTVAGRDALAFLQYTLTNSAAALELEEGQYTLIANERGGAVDDAYLYRFVEDAFLLVVNAANRDKDWEHLQQNMDGFDDVVMEDRTEDMAMISLQGPASRDILTGLMESGRLPEPMRNALSTVTIAGASVWVARTGYTGEPICFELFVDHSAASPLWDLLLERGAEPVGLGARDTLRLEAGLPLYGHELGFDPEGKEIPIFACPLAKFAVSFSETKGAYIGRSALERQFGAFQRILDRDVSRIEDLPRRILPIEMTGRGIARAGNPVLQGEKRIGYVTSGTMVPLWKPTGEGVLSSLSEETGRRAIGLALVDSDLWEGDTVEVEIRGKRVPALIVPYHLRSEAPPYARAITCHELRRAEIVGGRSERFRQTVSHLVRRAVDNHQWRQRQCINLIPSEQTPSSLARLLSVTDPSCRYAEHKPVKAFCEEEVFYYQGTDFIAQVEELLVNELRDFLGCAQVEARPLSGQMANTAVYSAIVDFVNRADRKSEQRRIRRVLNNHIIKGGHLSAQPLGALRDFVARDPVFERPAVVNFPVVPDNPYQIDVTACAEILETYRPELIIFGKSMVLHKEPVAEIRHMVDQLGLDCFILYDMAHVLGLVGRHFQQPFLEGADIVTG
ncbi:MAG: glycine cleavage system aminomethyltransferase GcvT, partial [Desulfobacteraceae bacterium]|nr:glycine cleavage system aminomethyltransferase GcvT [Desulfobacteraceae bacterium]